MLLACVAISHQHLFNVLLFQIIVSCFQKIDFIIYRQSDCLNIKFSTIYMKFCSGCRSLWKTLKRWSSELPRWIVQLFNFVFIIVPHASWGHRIIATIVQQIMNRHNNIKIFCIVYEYVIDFWYTWSKCRNILKI